MKLPITLVALCWKTNLFTSPCEAFSFSKLPVQQRSTTSVWGVIEADKVEDEEFDEGLGGVRLARESAIVIFGKVAKNNNPTPEGMRRYTEITSFDESEVHSAMNEADVTLVCSGTGEELYQNPGQSTEKNVVLAPLDAVAKAVASLGPNLDSEQKVLVNFIGGDDLMVHEVVEAVESMTSGLGLDSSKDTVEFHSLCHESLPLGKASVTVLAVGSKAGDKEDRSALERSLARGEMYLHEGKWWTVLEENLITDIA